MTEGLLLIESTVNDKDPARGPTLLTLGRMSQTKADDDFASRLRQAIEAEGKSQSRTEREAGLPNAYITRLLGTSTKAKQIFAPGPDVIRKLSDYLNVSYEWLAIGRGPMRREGFSESPLESAMRFAVTHGARQDAVDEAAKRFRDAPDMTVFDWIKAIDAEAVRLDRAGIPRPEVIERAQKKVRRLKATKARQEAELAELAAPTSKRRRRQS